MNHRLLITGAGGQLGSELTQRLWKLHGKENVFATDIKHSEGILSQGNFNLLNVLNENEVISFIHQHKITQIYHLAAVLSATGEKNPKLAWQLNMDGLINVLEAAVKCALDKVYWPSSIAVFGPSTPKNNTPQNTVMDPTTVYGISKQAGERWCEWYHQKKGVDIRSLRYPGLIGYKTKPGGGTTDYAVDIFIKALTEKKYTCFLDAHTQLPMMYMDDAVDATIALMEAPKEKVKIRSSYNISAISFSPNEIAAAIQKHIQDFKIVYTPDFRQSIADSWPKTIDDSHARNDWGWHHRFDLDEMVIDILKNIPAYL